MSTMDKWSIGRDRKTKAPVALYCFPYSGTGGVVYQPWVKALASQIDVCPVELPGRWGRLREPAFESVESLIEVLGPILASDLSRPYGLFGCSFGGLVAFELCRYMRRHGHPLPVHLFVAATRGPSVKRASPTMHMLSDAALIRRVADLYGPLPQAVLDSPDMRDMVLGILRADLKCVETYRYVAEPRLPVPMTIFGGTRDQGVTVDLLDDWRLQSESRVDIQILDAPHLFLASHERELLAVIKQKLVTNRDTLPQFQHEQPRSDP